MSRRTQRPLSYCEGSKDFSCEETILEGISNDSLVLPSPKTSIDNIKGFERAQNEAPAEKPLPEPVKKTILGGRSSFKRTPRPQAPTKASIKEASIKEDNVTEVFEKRDKNIIGYSMLKEGGDIKEPLVKKRKPRLHQNNNEQDKLISNKRRSYYGGLSISMDGVSDDNLLPAKKKITDSDPFDQKFEDEDTFTHESITFENQEIAEVTLIALLEALYSYGALAQQTHTYCDNICEALSIEDMKIKLTPSGLWFLKGKKAEFVHVSRGVDINKLIQVERLARKLYNREINCKQVVHALDLIHAEIRYYNDFFRFLCFPLYSAGFSVFFYGGNWHTVLTTLCLGCITGVYDWLSQHGYFHKLSYLHLFINCFIPGFITAMLVHYSILQPKCAYPTAFGATAIYFPGVSVCLSTLEMLQGYMLLGAIRYTYAQICATIISAGIGSGYWIWFSLIGPDPTAVLSNDICTPLIAGVDRNSQLLRCAFYFCCYTGALFYYNIPLRLYFPFFLTQASSYSVYYILGQIKPVGNWCALGCAVFTMVVIAETLSTRAARKFSCFRLMSPMATIIPSIELFVPGSSMVRSNMDDPTTTGLLAQTIAMTAIAISIGYFFGEAFVKIFMPCISGSLSGPAYQGPFNHWQPHNAVNNAERVKPALPDGAVDYFVVVLHSGSRFVAGGDTDPYIRIRVIDEETKTEVIVGRSSTKFDNTNPFWEEAFIIPIALDGNGKMRFRIEVMNYQHFGKSTTIGNIDYRINYFDRTVDINNGATVWKFDDIDDNEELAKMDYYLIDCENPEAFLSMSLGYHYISTPVRHDILDFKGASGTLNSLKHTYSKLHHAQTKLSNKFNSKKSQGSQTNLSRTSLFTRQQSHAGDFYLNGNHQQQPTIPSALAARLTRKRTSAAPPTFN